MCDTVSTLQSSFIFAALSLVPGNSLHYINLGLVCASLAIYAAHHHSPLKRLGRLENAIEITEEIMERAKSDYARSHLAVMDGVVRLLQAKLLASKFRSVMLEMPATTWKEYFQSIRRILKSIGKCAREVEEIRTAALLIIEAERQRKLYQGIKDAREVLDAVVHSQICYAHPGSAFEATAAFQELNTV